MSSTQIREPGSFGKRATKHSITVTHNGKSRHFNVNPVVVSVLASFAFIFMVGYFGATAYLIFRDDLISASYAKQARMQHEYEDRIAALRSKLDHVTSRQLLDQQAIETQVRRLMERQQAIGSRSGSMNTLLQKAEARGLGVTSRTGAIPVPSVSPAKPQPKTDEITTGSVEVLDPVNKTNSAAAFSLRGGMTPEGSQNAQTKPAYSNNFTDQLFGDIAEAMTVIDASQKEEVDTIRMAAESRTQKIAGVLKSIGVPVNPPAQSDIGGPFIPLDRSMDFDLYLETLEKSLERYDYVSRKAKALPLGIPVRNPSISSHFGSRVDPFNGRVAMHSGTDFRAKRGTPVLSTGAGKVVKAGRAGGYGKVVEVKHPGGYSTRYAHLSRITVKVGQQVKKGQQIGKVGSTGRSTGPHLHYEVRNGKSARNPARYMKAGKKIKGLL